ncbi:BQ2448_3288 [Microbotryum intermedium]|uniref:Disintegrin and metalloproteinase domain-containing protein B n=1 Tax=Microbotryum intermedium TaxID=269621 RepID=A0A238FCY5_9BASI|nr:BQ2448_3288 [Microbotryum intermedium]
MTCPDPPRRALVDNVDHRQQRRRPRSLTLVTRWSMSSWFVMTAAMATLLVTASNASLSPPRILHPRALSHPSNIQARIVRSATAAAAAVPGAALSDPRARRRALTSGTTPHALGSASRPSTATATEDDDSQATQDRHSLLRWDDRFILSFQAHNESLHFALRPSASIVHPNGIKVVETHTDALTGQRRTTESVLARHEVRVYEGVIIPREHALEDWVREEQAGVVRDLGTDGRGWAKILVPSSQADNDELEFQGSYSIDGDAYTIHSTPRYMAVKDIEDPEPPRILAKRGLGTTLPRMVIVRERDTLSPVEHIERLRKRGSPIPDPAAFASSESACGHDRLPFNTDPNHPVLASALDQSVYADIITPWVHGLFGLPSRSSPLDPAFSLVDRGAIVSSYPPRRRVKRQSGGDISGGTGSSSNFINSIGSTQGCPRSRRVVFIGVASDCTFTAQFSSPAAARELILTDFNSASTLYQTSFNVSLGIVELNVQSGSCPTATAQVDSSNPWNVGCPEGGGPGLELNDRLSVFSQWRSNKGGGDGAGLWHLLSNCSTGSEVGVAWLGQLCRVSAVSSGGQTTSGTGVTTLTRNIWQVIAHEIGHNFGAIHDCASGCSLSAACCPLTTSSCNANAAYIMSPVSARNTTTFSPCSIGNICYALGNSLNTSCLSVPGATGNPSIISIESCGNGILEAGEECDPGGQTDPCCNATTCRFVSGAVCSSLNSLCCNSCQIATNGTVCRTAVDTRCDIAETCSGLTADCPEDKYRNDGTSCGDDGLACATGVCTSQTLQCQNAGMSLNLTSSCRTTSTTCSITCQSPSSLASCVVLDQSYRDGTPCGYGGRCNNGECAAGSALDTAKGWFRSNLTIAIPVTIVIGLLIIAIIYAILRCCFCPRQSMRPRKNKKGPPSSQYIPSGNSNGVYYNNGAPPQTYQNGHYPPPPPQAYQQSNRNNNWVDPSAYNGSNYGHGR